MGRTGRNRRRIKIRELNFDGTDTNLLSNEQQTITTDLYQFMRNNSWCNDKNLKIKNFNDTGRGLYSPYNLNVNESIIEIPFNLLIGLVTIQNDEQFMELIDLNSCHSSELKMRLTTQSLLSVYLLYQRHMGESSKWSDYIKSIPDYFTNPLFCDKQELYFLPETILQASVTQNNTIKQNYSTFELLLKDKRCDCCGLTYFTEIVKLDDFKWAYFAVNSRSVFLDCKTIPPIYKLNNQLLDILCDSPNMAMVPFLDLLNHSDTAQTISQLNPNNNHCYQLITQRPYKKYEQIFIHYGSHSNRKLLLEYGFFIPDNQFDFIDVTMQDINDFIQSDKKLTVMNQPRNKFKYIKDHDLDRNMFLIVNDYASHNLIVVFTLLFIETGCFTVNYDQTAFGGSPNFDLIKEVLRNFVLFKRNDYESYSNGLKTIPALSKSGYFCLNYFRECIKYLNKILDN